MVELHKSAILPGGNFDIRDIAELCKQLLELRLCDWHVQPAHEDGCIGGVAIKLVGRGLLQRHLCELRVLRCAGASAGGARGPGGVGAGVGADVGIAATIGAAHRAPRDLRSHSVLLARALRRVRRWRDADGAPEKNVPLHLGERALALLVAEELHKAEPADAPGVLVDHDLGAGAGRVPRMERLVQKMLRDALRQVAHKNGKLRGRRLREAPRSGRGRLDVCRGPVEPEKAVARSPRNGLAVKHGQHFGGIFEVVEAHEAVAGIGEAHLGALPVSDDFDRVDGDAHWS